MLDFLIGGILASIKPANFRMIDKERETKRFAWLPVRTTRGIIWLKKYIRIDVYRLVDEHGPFGSKVYGWRLVENRRDIK